ncbi:uncharacterized protein [Ptychodera flava]|uniref:uncharacterized protein isoform X2 n=1 Tax=Ptychodera flava TaxID=63121 RepID=UPI00396A6B03
MENHSKNGERKPGCFENLADISNIYKAFLGSAFLSMPYGFRISGVILGIAGLLLCSSLMSFNGCLLVRCKREVVRRIMSEYSTTLPEDSSMYASRKEYLESNLKFTDIGRFCFGKIGFYLAEIFLCLIQFCFCVSYIIVIAVNFSSLVCTPTNPITNSCTDCHAKSPALPPGQYTAGFQESHRNLSSLAITHKDIVVTGTVNLTSSGVSDDEATTDPSVVLQIPLEGRFRRLIENSSDSVTPTGEESQRKFTYTSPCFFLLFVPIPIFMALSIVRKVRYIGPISGVSLTFGMSIVVCLLGYFIVNFRVHSDVVFIHWSRFPVYLGQALGALEGIGTMITIESSMVGNRHRFLPFFLFVIITYTLIIGAVGLLGYFVFGDDTQEIITSNLTADSGLAVFVKVAVCLSIGLTYPLQLVPVIEGLERSLFAPGRLCGPNVDDYAETIPFSESATETLVSQDQRCMAIPQSGRYLEQLSDSCFPPPFI